MKIKRVGQIIGLKKDKEKYYRELHSDTWKGVLERLKKSNIQNFSIYVTELNNEKYLFSYYEYIGDNYDKDMQEIAKDSITQKWWKECQPCQISLTSNKPGQWTQMEMVFLDNTLQY